MVEVRVAVQAVVVVDQVLLVVALMHAHLLSLHILSLHGPQRVLLLLSVQRQRN